MSLKKMSEFEGGEEFTNYISGINKIRSSYEWSNREYNSSNIENVYLIKYGASFVGFIDVCYQDSDICSKRPISLYLHEFHISASMQGKGIGELTLRFLLEKGLKVEMVVVNQNTKMLKLVEKLNGENKYITNNTRTVILSPNKI